MSSPLKQNTSLKNPPAYFEIGTGIDIILEGIFLYFKQILPNDHLIPGLQKGIQNMDRCCVKLAERFLSLLAIGLELKVPYIKEYHHERESFVFTYYPVFGCQCNMHMLQNILTHNSPE